MTSTTSAPGDAPTRTASAQTQAGDGASVPESQAPRPRRAAVQFDPIRQLRSHEYVAEQILRHISLRLIPPGWALPSERDLAQQFGVGRATIELALHELELKHLVEVRRGRRGGTFVARQGDDRAMGGLIDRILRQGTELEELLTYRGVLEPGVAGVAAQQHRKGDLRAMRRAIKAMARTANEPEYMRHDSEFHLALAAATRNRFMVEAIDVNRRGLGDLISLLPESDVWHERIEQEHETILRAVEGSSSIAARAAMELHVANSEQSARAMLAAIRRRAGRWTRDPLPAAREQQSAAAHLGERSA